MILFRQKSFSSLFVIGISIIPILGRIGFSFISNVYTIWLFDFLLLVYIGWYYRNFFHPTNKKDYTIIKIYLIWAVFCSIRGIFVAENYWEYKNLVGGILCLSLPVFTFVFQSPYILQSTLRLWLKYIIPLFLLIVVWVIVIDGYHFYISPVLLLGCFLPILPVKWKYLFLVLLLIMLLGELGARAQMMKAAMTLLIAVGISVNKIISIKFIKIVHWLFYILPIILLTLGIAGIYNIFQVSNDKYAGKYTQTKIIDGMEIVEDASVDTRSFIYEEVITSAVKHRYVIWGRTPARGNDSFFFGSFTAEELKTGKYERFMNEVCHPNVFTWLGLLGLISWCFIYLKSSFLAIYKSNNIYMKYIGIFIAFRFFLGWIEDVNNFNISGITVWMAIAMGFSEYFRTMDNREFRKWVISCFPFK